MAYSTKYTGILIYLFIIKSKMIWVIGKRTWKAFFVWPLIMVYQEVFDINQLALHYKRLAII